MMFHFRVNGGNTKFLLCSYGVASGQDRESVGKQSGLCRESPIKILSKSDRILFFHSKKFH